MSTSTESTERIYQFKYPTKIEGCRDCPCRREDRYNDYCQLLWDRMIYYDDLDKRPDWCRMEEQI
jgi:hypothetical protein